MVGFLERLFGRTNEDKGSGKVAKDRLQFVLVQDRIKLPADKLQAMKAEMLEVISKYVSVDLENVDFNLSNRERNGL
ncbi:MAG: cell division topological specificity factor MinE, partial [Chloroflexota bacterium]